MRVNVLISAREIAAPRALPNARSITTRRLSSGMVTVASSSAMVKVTSDGLFMPRLLVAVADTVIILLAALTMLSTAVIVTAPVLVVSPAAMVSVFALDSVKSLDIAGGTSTADTVTVVASLEAWSSVASTVLTPPYSEIDAGDSASVTVGAASSSVSVKAAPIKRFTPWLLRATPDTVMSRSGASCALSTAVIVTLSNVFSVCPAAMTIVESAPTA